MLDQAPSVSGVFLATVLFGAAVVLAIAPLGSRTLEEWLPILCAFALRGRTFRSRLPTLGLVREPTSRPGCDLPAAIGEVQIAEISYRDRPIGVLSERGGKRLTAVLACRVVAFALLDPEAQERRLARFGLVLSGGAGTPIRRIQWLERTIPAQGDELVRWLQAERDPAVPLRGTAMIDSYLELIGTSAKIAQEHEILR